MLNILKWSSSRKELLSELTKKSAKTSGSDFVSRRAAGACREDTLSSPFAAGSDKHCQFS